MRVFLNILNIKYSLAVSFLFHFLIIFLSIFFVTQKNVPIYVSIPVDIIKLPEHTDPVIIKEEKKLKPREPVKIEKEKEEVIPIKVKEKIALKKIEKKKDTPIKKRARKLYKTVLPEANISKQNTRQRVQKKEKVNRIMQVKPIAKQDFPYMYYLKILQAKISSHWKIGDNFIETRRAIVYFKINKDGVIVEYSLEKKSGNDYFDYSAIRAVKSASPLPPLPEAYQEGHLGVHFGFDLN